MFKSTILYILLLNTITIFSMNNNNNITVIGSYDSYACTLTFQDKTYECSLGRNGITNNKMEGKKSIYIYNIIICIIYIYK